MWKEGVMKRVGGIKDLTLDFRLIAATNKNLIDEIKAGRFREDFFYRLNVIPIVMPPLRSRLDDIPVFVAYFLTAFAKKHDLRTRFRITDEAFMVLKNNKWPGNIRELENVIERLVTLAEKDVIDAEITKEAINKGNFSSPSELSIKNENDLKESLESYEYRLIKEAMEEANGNQSKAAQKLNLTRQALHYKLKKYRIISDPEQSNDET